MNRHFKFFITLMVFSFSSLMVVAQDSVAVNRQNREAFVKRQALNTSNRLGLSADGKTRFIKVYSDYLNELFAVSDGRTTLHKDKMTEDDYKRLNEQSLENNKRVANIRHKYYGKFSGILTQKQIYCLRQFEKNDLRRLRSINKREENNIKRQAKLKDRAEKRRLKSMKCAEKRRANAAKRAERRATKTAIAQDGQPTGNTEHTPERK